MKFQRLSNSRFRPRRSFIRVGTIHKVKTSNKTNVQQPADHVCTIPEANPEVGASAAASMGTSGETVEISNSKRKLKVKYSFFDFVDNVPLRPHSHTPFTATHPCPPALSNDAHWEYTQQSQPIRVQGRLKDRIDYWDKIGTNPSVLQIIRSGYKIPFLSEPRAAQFKNNMPALKHVGFVEEAVLELLQSRRIVETSQAPHVVNPLSVSKVGEKLRLILDLTLS